LISVELRLIGLTLQDASQLVGEVEGVMNAAVQAHAADRTVDVGGVAGQHDAALAEFFRDALVHRIKVAAADFEGVIDAKEVLEPSLKRFGTFELVLVVVDRSRKMDSPAVRRALPVEKVRIFVRIRN